MDHIIWLNNLKSYFWRFKCYISKFSVNITDVRVKNCAMIVYVEMHSISILCYFGFFLFFLLLPPPLLTLGQQVKMFREFRSWAQKMIGKHCFRVCIGEKPRSGHRSFPWPLMNGLLFISVFFTFQGLFVDVGNNYSVLDNPNICFVYEYVGSKDSDREQSQYVSVDQRTSLRCYSLLHILIFF